MDRISRDGRQEGGCVLLTCSMLGCRCCAARMLCEELLMRDVQV